MTGVPHPATLIVLAEEHRAELLAQAERHRRAQQARAAVRQPRRERRERLPLAVTLAAALLALGVAVAQETPDRARGGAEAVDAPIVTETRDELLDPEAAREVFAARL